MEKYVFEAMMMMGYVDEALNRHKERMRPMVRRYLFFNIIRALDIGVSGYDSGSVNHAWSGVD